MSRSDYLAAIRTGSPTAAAIAYAVADDPVRFEFHLVGGATVAVTFGTATSYGQNFLASYRVTLTGGPDGDVTFEGLDFVVPSFHLLGSASAALQLLMELGTNCGEPSLCTFVANERAANDSAPWPVSR